MSKILVLAEKPSVGRDLARVLHCCKKGNGYLEGDKYVVTWALGHLVTLADPEAYDEKYKAWNIEDLPMLPDYLKIIVIKQTGKQYSTVKDLMFRNDINEIVIATDAGREGELVARWIIQKAGVKKPLKRLWISSVTDKAINEGFKALKDGKAYENLYHSAVARAEADWIVGINATRALTCKYNAQLSCGRVQTPTLAMIANREDEIKNFLPKKYYGINVNAQGVKFTWQDSKTKDTKTFNKDYRDDILKSIKNKPCEIIEIDKTNKKTYAPLLYDLTELQRDANKYYCYSAKETLSLMQSLYEHHKVLTYPRTDSRYISSDIVDTLGDRVKVCASGQFSKFCMKILRNPIKANKSFVDNSKVSDHHAIIPTEQMPSINSFSDKESKIYNLVVKRFLSVLLPPFEYEQTTITVKIGSEIFTAKGKRVLVPGFKELYDNFEDDDDTNSSQNLPSLNIGDIIEVSAIVETQGETKPSAPYNEGTLLSAMENPVKYMSTASKELIKTMVEAHGIGTVATRADIIEKLFNSFLIEKKGKDIFITSKGKQLLDLVPEELKSPLLTAEWEQKLNLISKGSLNKNVFINEMKKYADSVVMDIKQSNDKFKHDNLTRTKCPECGKYMLEVNGKHGKMLVCQDRECGHRKSISKVTNARCPECHKKMEMHGEGEGKVFVCKCGYREKLSSFNERKKKDASNLTKKDVAKYLKEQKKENNAPVNSALADALSKLKF
ncbi:MAG: DNA topoisomerase III [Solirubrobacterales bacterium]